MESIFSTLIAEYGLSGVILAFLIWQYYQNAKNKPNISRDDLTGLRNDIKTNMDEKINNISSYITSEREVLKEMIDLTDGRIDDLKGNIEDKISNLSDKIDNLDSQITKQPTNLIEHIRTHEKEMKAEHDRLFDRQLELGSEISDILIKYRTLTNFDHIFLGSFHNGTSSLSGVPYYKFDLIAEKFSPDKIDRDIEFAHMYYNADLMKHGKLPITLIQNNRLHYVIDENGYSDLSKIDDIIYRRMCGRNIKQIALQLLRDKTGKPMGFVGGVKYNYDRIHMESLSNCAEKLESLY